MNFDVVVVGAGIVGAACAQACSEGGLRVCVVDRGPAGGGATGAAMGHLVVMDDDPDLLALTHWSRERWLELELPAAAERDRCGTLWIATSEEEMAVAEGKRSRLLSAGVRCELVGPESLARLEPALRPGLAGALLVPDDAVVYPPVVARILLERAIERGTEMAAGATVVGVAAGRVLLEDDRCLHADHVLLATGQWTRSLWPRAALRPRKGHLLITERHSGFVRHQLIELGYAQKAHSVSEDSVAFNVQPRLTGQILIGSSRQLGDDPDDGAVEPAIFRAMLSRAQEYIPRLRELRALRAWTGHRAATADGLPLIGPDPEDPTVWLATGHEGLGITTALATARLVADPLLGRACPLDRAPFLPARATGEAWDG